MYIYIYILKDSQRIHKDVFVIKLDMKVDMTLN